MPDSQVDDEVQTINGVRVRGAKHAALLLREAAPGRIEIVLFRAA